MQVYTGWQQRQVRVEGGGGLAVVRPTTGDDGHTPSAVVPSALVPSAPVVVPMLGAAGKSPAGAALARAWPREPVALASSIRCVERRGGCPRGVALDSCCVVFGGTCLLSAALTAALFRCWLRDTLRLASCLMRVDDAVAHARGSAHKVGVVLRAGAHHNHETTGVSDLASGGAHESRAVQHPKQLALAVQPHGRAAM